MRTDQELGHLMEVGLSNSDFIESASRYFAVVRSYVCGCALAAAYIGMSNNVEEAVKLYEKEYQPGKELVFFSQVLDISISDASKIDTIHRFGLPTAEIAKRLKEARLTIEV